MLPSILYIVSSPIGNLSDISYRAIEILQSVDFIVCEDTRHSKKLLTHYNIEKPLVSFHAHSNENKIDQIVKRISSGQKAALLSDAGTPGISDPGFHLTKKMIKNNVKLVPIPGAAAFLTALQSAACPINQFLYLGFLPIKKGRQTLLKSLCEEKRTIVFYESVHRIRKTLEDLKDFFGEERYIIIARELTKIHEEFFRGTIKEAILHFEKPKGEFVIIIP